MKKLFLLACLFCYGVIAQVTSIPAASGGAVIDHACSTTAAAITVASGTGISAATVATGTFSGNTTVFVYRYGNSLIAGHNGSTGQFTLTNITEVSPVTTAPAVGAICSVPVTSGAFGAATDLRDVLSPGTIAAGSNVSITESAGVRTIHSGGRLCTFSVVTGITSATSTNVVSDTCTIPAGTLAALDQVVCEGVATRVAVSSTDANKINTGFEINGTFVHGGYTSSNSATMVRPLITIYIPTTASQNVSSTTVSNTGGGIGGNGSGGQFTTINTATTDLTIKVRAYWDVYTDDTISWNGGQCWKRSAN